MAQACGAILNVGNGGDEVMEKLQVWRPRPSHPAPPLTTPRTKAGGCSEAVAALFCKAATDMERMMALKAIGLFAADDATLAALAQGVGPSVMVEALRAEAEADVEEGESVGAAQMVVRNCVREDGRAAGFAAHPEALEALQGLAELPGTPPVARTAAVALSVLLADPGCRPLLLEGWGGFDAALARFRGWMDRAEVAPDEWDMPTAGAISAGNLALTEATAVAVASDGPVVERLFWLVDSGKSAFQYAALGVLKNLAVAPLNKPRLAAPEMIATVGRALSAGHGPIHHLAASLLRSLCTGQPREVGLRIGSEPGLFERLAHLGGEEEEAVASEATRAVAGVIRCCGAKDIAVPEQAVRHLVRMVGSKHLVLVSEALVTLARLASQPDHVPAAAEAVAAAADVATTAAHDTKLRMNALTLLGTIRAGGARLPPDVVSKIVALAGDEDAGVAALAATLSQVAL